MTNVNKSTKKMMPFTWQARKKSTTMMKDKIKIQRDMAVSAINGSKNLSAEDKMYLVDLVTEAAEGTNGLNEKDKLQNVSETTFNLAVLLARVDDKINVIPTICDRLDSISKALNHEKEEEEKILNTSWITYGKALLMKPWPYLLIAVASFSPFAVDIVKTVIDAIK